MVYQRRSAAESTFKGHQTKIKLRPIKGEEIVLKLRRTATKGTLTTKS